MDLGHDDVSFVYNDSTVFLQNKVCLRTPSADQQTTNHRFTFYGTMTSYIHRILLHRQQMFEIPLCIISIIHRFNEILDMVIDKHSKLKTRQILRLIHSLVTT